MSQDADNLPPHPMPDHPTPARPMAVAATAAFIALIFLPGIYHLAYGLRTSDLRRWGDWLRNKPTPEAVRAIDDDFDRRFLLRFVAVSLTEKVPKLQARASGEGVQVGTGGFLFAEEDTRVCTAAGFLHPHFPKPAEALSRIVAFDRRLKERGMRLLVAPVPAKATIYPDRLDPKYDLSRGPFVNVDQDKWFEKLREAGVDALDLTPALWSRRNDAPGPVCYPADTHWTEYGKRVAAEAIVGHLQSALAAAPRAKPYQTRTVSVVAPGNLVEPGLPVQLPLIREEVVQLYDENGMLNPGTDAPVVLIGDSQAELGVEAGHGLAQRLTEALGVDVQSAAIAGGKPDEMQQAIAENPAALRPGRVVVWVFSIRHLLISDWDAVELAH